MQATRDWRVVLLIWNVSLLVPLTRRYLNLAEAGIVPLFQPRLRVCHAALALLSWRGLLHRDVPSSFGIANLNFEQTSGYPIDWNF